MSSQAVNWKGFEETCLQPVLEKMAETNQDPVYHGEGNVLLHTQRVCEELLALPYYQKRSEEEKLILFLAALLHDIGKIRCTVLTDGRLRSPHHAAVGSLMARELLWRELGLCGGKKEQRLREAICNLVRYHSFPPYALSSDEAEYKTLKIAANTSLAQGFSMAALCALETADVRGRICADAEETLERIALCEILATDLGCADAPYRFADDFSGRAYFKGKTAWKEQRMYRDTWGEVILMSGLPGTGKDTWIGTNCPELPMISLDEIRRELNVSPTENQGRVVALGHERAREYLRRKQPFVWNATNITSKMRHAQIALFEEYGASVKTVFLETEWEEQLRRNAERARAVPVPVIEGMLSKLEPPERFESEQVLWEIV